METNINIQNNINCHDTFNNTLNNTLNDAINNNTNNSIQTSMISCNHNHISRRGVWLCVIRCMTNIYKYDSDNDNVINRKKY
jgi:hypothetical protein